MPALGRIEALAAKLTERRRDLRAHPRLGSRTVRTVGHRPSPFGAAPPARVVETRGAAA